MLGTLDKGLGLKAKYTEKKKDRMFRGGFGQYSSAEAMALFDEGGLSAFRDISVDMDEKEEPRSTPEIEIRRGRFKSPLSGLFPPFKALDTAYIEVVKPAQESKIKAVMVLFPATGDQGFEYRRERFAMPLAKQGIASVSLMIPYYGARKPMEQHEHYLRTVSGRCMPRGGNNHPIDAIYHFNNMIIVQL